MKRKIIYDILVILALGLIPLLWFHGNQVILGHDSGLPFDPVMHFVDRIYLWSQRFGIGTDQSPLLLGAFLIHGTEAFLSFIGLPLQVVEKIQFVLWFTLPGLAMYFFVHKIWPEKKYMAIVASLVYMINYYLIQGWFIAERTKFSIYTALPIFLFLLIAYLTKKMKFLPSVIFAGLTLGIFNGGGSFPLYGGLILVIFITYLYINLIYLNRETLKRTLLFSVGVGVIYILLNSYWLIPYFIYVLSFYTRDLANAGGAEGVLTWVAYLSKGSTISNLLRGQGIPEWYLNEFHPYASTLVKNPVFIILSYGFTAFAFFPLLVKKAKKDKFYFLLLILMAFVAVIFSAGTNSPFGIIFEAFVRYVPGFAMFRSSYYKFDYVVWFSYAVLIGFSIDYLISRFIEKKPKLFRLHSGTILLTAFIFIYLFYHYPVLNGLFFDYSSNPKSKLTTRITVPQYVFDFGKWVDKEDPNKRFLVLPELNDSTYISYKWGYWSLAPVSSLLTRNSFVQNTGLITSDERFLTKQMYSALLNKDFDSFFGFADLFAINDIVIQKDFDWDNPSWPTTDPRIYESIIRSDPRFKLEKVFGNWEVYKILGREKTSRISISHSLYFVQGKLDDVVSFPDFNPKIPLYLANSNSETNNYFMKEATNVFLSSNCIGCDLKIEDNGFTVYNPKILPGSLLYFLIEKNEERVLKRSTDFSSKVNFYLTASDRRSIEAKWMVEFGQNLGELQNTLLKHNQELVQLKTLLDSKDWHMDDNQKNDLAKMIVGHLLTQSSLITSIHNNGYLTLENRITISSSYEIMTSIINSLNLDQWTSINATEKKYIYKFPVLGKYDLYVKKTSLADPTKDASSAAINIKELGLSLKPIGQIKDWLYFGSVNLVNNFMHLSFDDTTVTNLINGSPIIPASSSGITKQQDSYLMTGDSQNKCFSFPIEDLEVGNKYAISFKYRNFNNDRSLSMSIDTDPRETSSLRTKETLLPGMEQWTTFSAPFSPLQTKAAINFCNGFLSISEIQGLGPWLNFQATNHGIINPSNIEDKTLEGKVAEIKDISLYKLSSPVVVFYKKSGSADIQEPITTVRKSPIEYDVTLSPSKFPTFVTLRESYGKYWQLCENGGNCLPFDDRSHFAADAEFLNTWYFKNGTNSNLKFYYYPQNWFIIGSVISVSSYLLILMWIIYRKKRE